MEDLVRLSAREAVALLGRGEVSPLELIDAALARIEAIDPALNALPTLCVGRARAAARRIMDGAGAERAGRPGWLAGLPVVIKDMSDVAGVRTTYGSPIFRDHVPARSSYEVERLEAAGAVVLAKSNTPEFAAGGNTFNEVFGVTRNPWDRARTCGGSSGGSAVALATGMAWLATGSDLGGSLRLPAAFCGVVGLRPSPGRVPQGPEPAPFQTLSVAGPMARDVRDLALMLDAMVGFDARDPRTFDPPEVPFACALEEAPPPRRVAFSADLGGITPVDREVGAVCRRAADRLAASGIAVDEAAPDLRPALEVFTVLRAELYAAERAPLLEDHRARLKPEVVWNIERGLALTAGEIGRAERQRGVLLRRLLAFFEAYDLLLCPAAIVPP
ncbi:MAG TPA: amidase family protein, partial [Geminicoccaceae bacterium]|nr:amidase family protein [Geminicoccaceae bacterium]